MSDRDRVERLLASVSDGAEIDWARESADAGDERERATIASLRSISAIWELSDAGAGNAGSALGGLIVPGAWLGHLRIVEKLGSGAYGDVYRAWDSRLEREVALKILAPEEPSPGRVAAASRAPSYLEEARRLAGVRHPNVVSVYSIERLEGDPLGRSAIAMELVQGRTLADVARRDGRLGAREIAAIGIELCRALSAVHRGGMVHRDVKAQNVMREEGGRIVLMDFGPGGGTPLYMAPEVVRGEAPSIASDLYSLAVLLYYLATGDYPVRGVTMEDLRAAHAQGSIPLRDARPELPAPLVRAIESGLTREPEARPASAGAFERALAAAIAGDPRESAPIAQVTRPRRPMLQGGIVLASAALVVMIGVGAYLAAREGRDARREHAAAGALDAGAAAASGSFTIAAAAHRGSGQRERLSQGARVAPGDSISLSISASESLYVYVINQDERGEAYLLFPAEAYRPRNPLSGGVAHRLPGARDGRLAYWQITSAGGREHMLLVASRARLGSLEDAAEALARPSRDGEPTIAALDPATLGKLRGMGGYVEEEGAEAARALSGSLFEIAEPLKDGEETTRGIWIRKLVLENPGR